MNFLKAMVENFSGKEVAGKLFFKYYDRTYEITEVTDKGIRYSLQSGFTERLAYPQNDTFLIRSVRHRGSLLRPNYAMVLDIRSKEQ